MTRRSLLSGIFAAAALVPALVWLAPALVSHAAPSFRDQGDFFYPLKLYTADRIRAGELPLWNPLSGLGEPWLANLQSGVFYPPTLLFLLRSPALAGGLYLLLHFAIAAWGARRFLKDEAVSDSGALFGAFLFAGGGFAASLSAYWNHFGGWSYLPAIAALARSGLPTRGSRLGLAALFFLEALAGSPEMLGAAVAVAILFALWSRASRPEWADVSRARRVSRCAASLALGLALAACSLVPFFELAARSDRGAPLSPAERDFGSAGSPALASFAGLSGAARATSYLPTLAFGPAALFAAAAAFTEKSRRGLAAMLAAIAVAGVLLSLAGPPGSWLRALPGLDRIRYPAKALGVSVFALAILAGLGADALRFTRLARPLFWRAAAAAGLLLLAFSSESVAARTAGAGALVALALLTFPLGTPAGTRALLHAISALLLGASLVLAARPLFRFAPESELRRRPDTIAFLARISGRVLTPPMRALAPWVLRDARFDAETLRRQRETLLGYTNLLQDVRTIRTAAPLATRDAAEVADAIDRADALQPVAGSASARLLWTPFLPPAMGSRKVGEFFRAPINPYRPRLTVTRAYEVEPDPERARRLSLSRAAGGFDRVLLDRAPSLAPAPPGGRSFLVARLAEDRAESVVADVTTGSAAVAVLTDLDFPGWIAELDGRRVDLLRADGVFRAVAVPAGSHRVTFRYRPVSLRVGGAISAVALFVLLLLAWRGEPSDRRALL